MKKILAFSGSARRGSYNQALITLAAEAAGRTGLDVTLINLGDFPLPLFSEDLEAGGMPSAALALKKHFLGADGFLVSTPEYNSTLTPLFKNAVDWVSRPAEGEKPLQAFAGKPAAIFSASPGAQGGKRAIAQLRQFFTNIRIDVVDSELSLGSAADAFDEQGRLKDTAVQARLEGVVATLAGRFV